MNNQSNRIVIQSNRIIIQSHRTNIQSRDISKRQFQSNQDSIIEFTFTSKHSKLKMKNDQNRAPPPTLKRHKHSNSQHAPLNQMNRLQQLRDKKAIYPESTLNKIVFISNLTANGFKRQNLYLYNVPAHINLQKMIHDINEVCFNQWRISFQALEAQPLYKYDQFLTIIGYSILIIILVLIFFLSPDKISVVKYFVYVFIGFITVGCIYSVFLMSEKRVDINKDADMIKAIKKELMRLNHKEQINFPKAPRFKWTCHKDCLWIACEFF